MVFAVLVALLGSLLGIAGAVVQEVRSGGGILLVIIGAPAIEECLKPAGVYVLLARWPRFLRGTLFTACLAALSGLAFGLVESLVYVTIYVSDPPDWFVTFRFTATPALHATTSFIAGLGINRGLIDWAEGKSSFPKRSLRAYAIAIGIHAVYNTTALVLTLSGVIDAD